MHMLTAITHDLTIDIGAIPILVRTDSREFAHMLEDRYGEFVTADAPHAVMELEIELIPPGTVCDAEDVRVRRDAGRWVMERGDFRAEWDPQCQPGLGAAERESLCDRWCAAHPALAHPGP